MRASPRRPPRSSGSYHGGSGELSVSSYEGVMAGGTSGESVSPCDCDSSLLWQKLRPDPPFGGRMPDDGPPYLSEPEIALICDWIDEGAGLTYDLTACATEPPPECSECGDGICAEGHDCETCPEDCGSCESGGGEDEGGGDQTPPSFEGLDSIDEIEPDTCELFFEPAQDDVTLPGDIVYEAYAAPQNQPVEDTGDPDASARGSELEFDGEYLIMQVALEPGTRYDLVVRAVDEAGNRDDNDSIEDCDLR